MSNPTITCTECGLTKPLDCFYEHKGMASGHYNQCKLCMYESQQNRRLAKRDPNPVSAMMARWGRA